MNKIYSPFLNDVYFKSSSSAIAILDSNFNVVDINESALKTLNYKEEEILGKNIIEFTIAAEFEINYDQIKRLTTGEIPNYKVIRKFFDKKGTNYTYEILISLLKDPNNNKIYYSGLFNKLGLFKTKQTIDIDSEKIDELIEKSPIMQYIFDIDKNANIYENKSLLNYLGYNNKDLKNLTEFEFLDTKISRSHFKEFKSKLNKFIKSKNPDEILKLEYPIMNSKGEMVWIYDKSVSLKVKKNGEKIYSYGVIIDITERKLNESKISEQQNFIEKVSRAIPEFIFMLKTNSEKVLFSNKRSKQITGYTEEEFSDASREELVHPSFFVDYYDELKDFNNSTKKKSYVTKIKLLHKTKGYRWFKIRTIVFDRLENSKPKRVLKIIEDINDIEINISKNKAQQNFIKNVTSKLPSTVYVVDLKTRKILFSNVKSKNIFGYTNKYWLENVNTLLHPDFLDDQRKKINIFINSNQSSTLESEVYIKHNTKGYRWYKTRLKIIKRDIHNKPEQILEIFDDIHEVKMKNIKISDQENLITTITNSMTSYQYLCDIENGKYTYTNFENRKIFGYTKKEYLGQSSRFVHPEHKVFLNDFVNEIKTQLNRDSFSIEIKIKPKRGPYVWVNYKVIVLNRKKDNSPSQILEVVEDVNEAKNKAIKIAEQQDLIEKISSSIPEFIYLKNYMNNELIFSNNKANEILGYDDTEFVSTKKEEFVDDSQITKLKKYQKNILNEKEKNIFSIDLLIKHKTLGFRWYKNTTIVFEREANKTPKTTLELVSDINNTKLNEEQILEQQRFIENISSTVPQFLSVYDLKTNECLYTNFENKLIFGYNRKEYLSFNDKLIHPEYREKTKLMADKMINSTNSKARNAIEFQIHHKDKGYIWAKLKVLVTKRDKNGVAIQALEIIEDIDKTKKSFNQILEQQNFIQKVASTIPNIVQVIKIRDKKIIYSNFEKRIFLGYSKQEWESLRLDAIHAKYYKKIIGEIQELIVTQDSKLIKNEILIKDKNGNYKWVLIICSIFKIEGSEVDQLMTVFTDINDTKVLQLQLEKQLSKNIELERFASITSHDLKEPLRTLGNYAQILQSQYSKNLDDEAQELLNHISKSSKRMDELINDILDFSKVQTEGRKFERLQINDLIKIVLEDLKDLISESKTVINIVDFPVIEGDKTQLRQVFQNLISNAIKFTKGKTPVININVELDKNNYIFSIEDNGIGIKQEDQNNIFKIFKKLHRQNEFEGQGIGLSICKRIIERHDGEIWLYSEEGKGTTFYFSIPVNN